LEIYNDEICYMKSENNRTNSPIGFFSLLISGVLYSTFGILIRFASRSFDTFFQVFLRCLVTACIAAVVVFFRRSKFVLPKVPITVLVLFLFTPFLSIASLTYAIQSMKAANAIFCIYIGYLLTTLGLGIVWYKERITWNKLAALALVFVGVFCFAYPFAPTSFMSMMFAALAGVLDGISSATCKTLGIYNKYVLLVYRYSLGMLMALGAILIFNQRPFIPIHIDSVIAVGILGAGIFAIDSLWLYGFSHFDLNLGSIVTSVELLIVPGLNAFVLREYITANELIGGLLIFIAIIVVNVTSHQNV
jgi:drug/metabolite transporter (DMT)-like permease